jgi:hypothetical protein
VTPPNLITPTFVSKFSIRKSYGDDDADFGLCYDHSRIVRAHSDDDDDDNDSSEKVGSFQAQYVSAWVGG